MTDAQKRKQLTALFGAYDVRLEKLYDKFVRKLTHLAHRAGVGVEEFLGKDVLFRFDKYPELREELNKIFADYVQNNVLAYRAGITDGVSLAYSQDKALLTGFSVLSDKAITHARNIAAETFIRSRLHSATGLNLSQLVWNYCQQTKSEFEMAISNVLSDGLRKGTSAEDLGRMVRQYLNNPDMMYRRYHRTVVDAQGNKRDVVKWRRRIIDENGKVRFVEQPLEKVGMGHYRSSRMNAKRLMRTEINMSYHRANCERWQKEPFVIGIMIELSPEHPREDECDELQGRYPKDFMFIGWHVQCLCMANPITLQGEEKEDFYRRLAAGEDMSDYHSKYEVKDIPDKAKAWITDNKEKFIRAGERGKLGYVWRENMKYVGKQFTPEELAKMGYTPQQEKPKKRVKTDAEKAEIQRRWDERKANNAFKQEVRTLYNEVRQIPFFDRELLNNVAAAYKANDIATLRDLWRVFSKRARYEISITPKEIYRDALKKEGGGGSLWQHLSGYNKIKIMSESWGKEEATMRLRLYQKEAADMSNSHVVRLFAEKEYRRAADEVARGEAVKEFLEMSKTLSKYSVKYTHPIEYQELIDLPLMQKEVARIKPYYEVGKRIDAIEAYINGMNEHNRSTSSLGKLFSSIRYDIEQNGLRPNSKFLLNLVSDAEAEVVRMEKGATTRALKSGKLAEGQYMVKLESLDLKKYGWKTVDDVDLEKVFKDYFDKNDGLLYRNPNRTSPNNGKFFKLVIKDDFAFMAHNAVYFDLDADIKHTFYVYTRTHPSSGNFNAYKDLKSALFKIAKKEALTFNEEYSLESFWHEIMHGRAKGFSIYDYKKTEGKYRNTMETINQFLARRSYDNFMRSLGGVAKYSADVYTKGYGYGSYVRHFNELLTAFKISPEEVVNYFKSSLLENPYQDVRENLVNFLTAKTGKKAGIKKLVDSMYDSDYEFSAVLKKITKK